MSTNVITTAAPAQLAFTSTHSDSKLQEMSFVDLDRAIDHELVRCNEKLIPYLQEMHERLDAQGSRNDLHPDTPAIGWQAWVKSKQHLLGSLSKVNRLLAAPRDPAPELSAVEDAVVKALVAQGYKKKDAVQMTKEAEGEDFDSLFRSALRAVSGDGESPESAEEGEEPQGEEPQEAPSNRTGDGDDPAFGPVLKYFQPITKPLSFASELDRIIRGCGMQQHVKTVIVEGAEAAV
jgi:hypothetical protein